MDTPIHRVFDIGYRTKFVVDILLIQPTNLAYKYFSFFYFPQNIYLCTRFGDAVNRAFARCKRGNPVRNRNSARYCKLHSLILSKILFATFSIKKQAEMGRLLLKTEAKSGNLPKLYLLICSRGQDTG